MRAPTTEFKHLAQFIWDEGNLQVSDSSSCSCSRHKRAGNGQISGKSLGRVGKDQEIFSVDSLNDYCQLFRAPSSSFCSAAQQLIQLSNQMNPPEQYQLITQLVQQQQQQKLNELKQYQASLQEQHRQNYATAAAMNLWLSSLITHQNGTATPANLFQDLIRTTAPSFTPTECQQIAGFDSNPGILGTSPFPANIPSFAAVPLLNAPSVDEAQMTKFANILVANEQQKMATSTEREWQNLTKHQNSTIPKMAISNDLISPILKRHVTDSTQQQLQHQTTDSANIATVKRAKVIVIEQKDPEPVPCSSNSSSSVVMNAEKDEQSLDVSGKQHINSKCKKRGRKIALNGGDDSSRNYEEGDDDDAQYVDVETVEEKVDSKEQRKALVELYRKVKSVRMSYSKGNQLMCQMCEQQVQNSDSLILMHLYGHAKVMPYRCKMCGASECQLERIYAHIRQGHPNKDPSTTYESRRNMTQLICLLQKCFPRNFTKTKAAYSEVIDKICEVAKEKSLVKVKCMICTRKISTRKMAITRHAQTHLHYRCKDCGVILFGDATIVEHSTKKHGISKPQRATHYDACINTSEKTEIALKNCFSDILNEKY